MAFEAYFKTQGQGAAVGENSSTESNEQVLPLLLAFPPAAEKTRAAGGETIEVPSTTFVAENHYYS